MPSDQTNAEHAIQEAVKELRFGKKQAARSWALKALSLSPELEEPWLIMGELVSPESSFHFYQEALKINPGSQRAQNGLKAARERALKTGQGLYFNIPQSKTEVSLPVKPAVSVPVSEDVHAWVPTPLWVSPKLAEVPQAPVSPLLPQARVPAVSLQVKKPRQKDGLRYKRRIGLWLIAPWLVGLLLFKLIPILATLAMSFTNMDLLEPFQYKFVGIKNYIELFADPRLGVAFLGTLKSALILIPLQVLAAIALASLLSSQKLHFKNTYRMLFFLPSIIASFPAYLMWSGFTNPESGWLYSLFLNPLGLAKYVNFLGVGIVPIVKLLSTLWSIGPGFLIMMGAMQGIPADVYEAAMVDGASRLRNFFAITIPLISQAIFFTVILNLTTLFGGTIMMDIGYTFKTDLSSVDAFLYDLLFYSFHLGSAASLAWIFFIVMLVVVLVLFATSKYWVYFPDRVD